MKVSKFQKYPRCEEKRGWGEGEGNQHRKDEARPSNSANSGSTREQKGHAEKSVDGVVSSLSGWEP